MPVYLDEVPAEAGKISRPVTLYWIAFLVFIVVTGIVLTLWQWMGERNGFSFWFAAIGLPFCIWGFLFSIRRIGYKAELNGHAGWNYECETLKASEISRGKRFAWILDSYIHSQAGRGVGSLLASIEQILPLMDTIKPRSGGIPIRHSRLNDFDYNPTALEDAVNKVAKRIGNTVEQLPETVKCWLMFECDTQSFAVKEDTLIHLLSLHLRREIYQLPVQGVRGVDYWLDQQWAKPSVLIVLTASLRLLPKQNDAEAITALVLCNRRSHHYPDAVKLHRPQKSTNETLTRNMAHSLRWAKTSAAKVTGVWVTGEDLTMLPGWNQACEENELVLSLTGDLKNIDVVLGFAGKASPWIAIALAAAVVQDKGVQLIAAHPEPNVNEVWIATITAEGRQKDVTKE